MIGCVLQTFIVPWVHIGGYLVRLAMIGLKERILRDVEDLLQNGPIHW